MIARLRQWLRGADRGGPAAEIGLVLPLLLFLIGSVLEFGLIMFQIMEVNNATEAAAAYAAHHSTSCCSSSFNSAVQSVMQSATALGSNITAGTPAAFCACAGSSGLSCANSTNSLAQCSTAYPGNCTTACSDGTNPGTFVMVTGSYNLISNLFPWLPNSGQILPSSYGASMTVRIQ